MEKRDVRPWLFLISLLCVVLDRLSKLWINAHVSMGSAITVIPRVFRITHVLNFGAAFSMFGESASPNTVRWSLIVFSAIAVVVVAVTLWRTGRELSPAALGLALILGGAIGNMYDRAVLHYVIDFLEVHIGSYHWPDFNVADSCICVGAGLLMVEILWPHKKDEAAA